MGRYNSSAFMAKRILAALQHHLLRTHHAHPSAVGSCSRMLTTTILTPNSSDHGIPSDLLMSHNTLLNPDRTQGQ